MTSQFWVQWSHFLEAIVYCRFWREESDALIMQRWCTGLHLRFNGGRINGDKRDNWWQGEYRANGQNEPRASLLASIMSDRQLLENFYQVDTKNTVMSFTDCVIASQSWTSWKKTALSWKLGGVEKLRTTHAKVIVWRSIPTSPDVLHPSAIAKPAADGWGRNTFSAVSSCRNTEIRGRNS